MPNSGPMSSRFLAFIAWVSFFVESWLIITRQIEVNNTAWGFLVVFAVIALLSSLLSVPRQGN